MAISDYVAAQGAVMRARELRAGAALVSQLLPQHMRDDMAREAKRLEDEVQAWCAAQPIPREASALAHRRFWELDTTGSLLASVA